MECHGNFRSCSCTSSRCGHKIHDSTDCERSFMQGSTYTCPKCGSLVKPDVVFFGEELPMRFQDLISDDVDACDLLVVMGTSLLVAPVSSIPRWVGKDVPRILINRELVGDFRRQDSIRKAALDQASLSASRDVFVEGDCDDGVHNLCQHVGSEWEEQLHEIFKTTQ